MISRITPRCGSGGARSRAYWPIERQSIDMSEIYYDPYNFEIDADLSVLNIGPSRNC